MLLHKKDFMARTCDLLAGYASYADNRKHIYTLIADKKPRYRGAYRGWSHGEGMVEMPWGTMPKAPLNEFVLQNKLTRKTIDITTKLLVHQIGNLANSGGGSFGPYKVMPSTDSKVITIKKKPAAKTRKQAINRIKELVFLTYGLTLQDEINKGTYVSHAYYTGIKVWGCDLPQTSPGVSLMLWGSPVIMRLGKTLSVLLGLMLNPWSDYFDLYANLQSTRWPLGIRGEERNSLITTEANLAYCKRCSKRATSSTGLYGWHISVKRTNLKTGVPDTLYTQPSFWFDCFNGPQLPEFHFYLQYANNFSIQYSPKEKNKWNIHMLS